MGLAPDEAMVVFPLDLFSVDSDLSPVEKTIDQFIAGLTKWESAITGKTRIKPAKVMATGRDYEEALTNMNRLFLKNMWGDGLPLLPPTEPRVKWILKGTDLSPDVETGRVLVQGRIADVETIAVALGMAGGRPEYLPVLIAAMKAILDPDLRHQRWTSSSCSAYPVVIVNGPIGNQIHLNSGFGLIGPDSRHPAGGIIGRAMRLILQNVGGAFPGSGTMAMFGGLRHTNAIFAEDEAGLPPGWEPLNVEYFHYPEGTNTVAAYAVSSASNIFRRAQSGYRASIQEEALDGLYRIAAYMKSPNVNTLESYEGPPGILLISRVVANQMASVGWTKDSIKEFLWENSKIPLSDIERTGMMGFVKASPLEKTLRDPWPLTSKPKNLMLVVAGGAHPTHAYWMQGAGHEEMPQSRKIELPANWEELLKEAEEDS
ncbi:MAG: hypothetical protein HYX87_00375 [Chloroflexi bacterium]|nr:hypothetical protein [Chloroflexota bacterium]